MLLRSSNEWEVGVVSVAVVAFAAAGFWLLRRKRPTSEELERRRRKFLVQFGRLSDGTLVDVAEMTAEDGRQLTMLIYQYRIGGVDYECSQDATFLAEALNLAQVRVGFPCTVRYQPGNPQNSIVAAEEWSGLRVGVPLVPSFSSPDLLGMSPLRTGRG